MIDKAFAHFSEPRTTANVLTILNGWPHRDFEYGRADCCQLAAFVARELTGINHLAGVEYDSEDQAGEILRRSGGLSRALTAILGEPVPIAELLPGDPVLVKWKALELAAVYMGTDNAAGIDYSGNIVEIPLRLCRYGWNLPCPV